MALAIAVALATGFGIGFWQEANRWAEAKQELLLRTAHVLAAAAGKATAERDTAGVISHLRALARIPGLIHAAVDDSDGQRLAELGNAVRLTRDVKVIDAHTVSLFDLLQTGTVEVQVPVHNAGLEVGSIRLISDASGLESVFWGLLASAAWAAAIALGLGLLISIPLQRSITQPLVKLTRTMARVRENHDYAVRIEVPNEDEIGMLADTFNEMLSQIRSREREVVTRLVRAAEYRDTDTGEHINRVSGYVTLIAEGLGLEPRQIDMLGLASTMHDVGKISVPDSLLLKRGPLSAEERREMERHALVGRQILEGSSSELIQLAADIAFSHHERWDGAGYPNGLKGEDIPLPARIVAVADVFDALTSERPYKSAWPVERARAHLESEAGRHFDPACVEAFLRRWGEVLHLAEHRLVGQQAA